MLFKQKNLPETSRLPAKNQAITHHLIFPWPDSCIQSNRQRLQVFQANKFIVSEDLETGKRIQCSMVPSGFDTDLKWLLIVEQTECLKLTRNANVQHSEITPIFLIRDSAPYSRTIWGGIKKKMLFRFRRFVYLRLVYLIL